MSWELILRKHLDNSSLGTDVDYRLRHLADWIFMLMEMGPKVIRHDDVADLKIFVLEFLGSVVNLSWPWTF